MAADNVPYPPPPYSDAVRDHQPGYGFKPYYTQQPPHNQHVQQQHPPQQLYGQQAAVVGIVVAPKDYFCLSVFTLLCCCLPVGVAALICSYEVQSANAIGDLARAVKASNRARIFNYVALVLGACLWLSISRY